MLSAGDIHLMRATVDRAMPGTAVVTTLSQVSDGMGGQTDSYAATGTVSARVDYMSAEEAEIAGRLAERASYVLTVTHDAGLTETDRIVHASGTYEVTAVLPVAPWDLCQRAYLSRID